MRTLRIALPLLVVAAGLIGAVAVDKNTPACIGSVCYVPNLVVDGGAVLNGQALDFGYPMAVTDSFDAGLPTARTEYGISPLSSGSLAVTFAHAFGAAPVCNCTHTDTTNTNPCTIHVAATTTGVTFAVASGGTDRVTWQCIGDK